MKKVTAFILRKDRTELLLIFHEDGSIQIPAGTVESGEDVLEAGVREAREETGLSTAQIRSAHLLEHSDDDLDEHEAVIEEDARVYSRPRLGSMNWGIIPRGITVQVLRTSGKFTQVRYEDWHDEVERDYLTYSVTGWIESGLAGRVKTRYYCVLEADDGRDEWTIENDHHLFHLKWTALGALPETIYPDNRWITVLSTA